MSNAEREGRHDDGPLRELLENAQRGPQEPCYDLRANHLLVVWICAALAVLIVPVFLVVAGLCLQAVSFSQQRWFLSTLLGLVVLWLIAISVPSWLGKRVVGHAQRIGARLQLSYWGAQVELLLAPLTGQIRALLIARSALRLHGRGRPMGRPLALVHLCIALGWPCMLVAAAYALAPLFSLDVASTRGTAARIEVGVASHVGPVLSVYLVYGSAGLLQILRVVRALALYRQQRTQAERARQTSEGHSPLAAGDAVVAGVVELPADGSHAVRVEIDQAGSEEERSGSWSHAWTETDRRIFVAPFHIRHASGELVRVLPTEKVHLMDALDGVIQVDLTRRQVCAELVPGERVIATGILARSDEPQSDGDKQKGSFWTLHPPREDRMILATVPLDEGFRQRAKKYLIMAGVLGFLTVAAQSLMSPYHLRAWAAQDIAATVTSREEVQVGDGKWNDYFVQLTSSHPSFEMSQEVDRETYQALVEGSQASIRYVAAAPEYSQLGPVARVNWKVAMVSVMVLLFAGWNLSLVAEQLGRAWYDVPKVVDSYQGRLPGKEGE